MLIILCFEYVDARASVNAANKLVEASIADKMTPIDFERGIRLNMYMQLVTIVKGVTGTRVVGSESVKRRPRRRNNTNTHNTQFIVEYRIHNKDMRSHCPHHLPTIPTTVLSFIHMYGDNRPYPPRLLVQRIISNCYPNLPSLACWFSASSRPSTRLSGEVSACVSE